MEPINSKYRPGDIIETNFKSYKGIKLRIRQLYAVRPKSQYDENESSRNLWTIEYLDGKLAESHLSEGWFIKKLNNRKSHLPEWW